MGEPIGSPNGYWAANAMALAAARWTIDDDQEAEACDEKKATVDGPFLLASHKAARKDADSLQNPDATHE